MSTDVEPSCTDNSAVIAGGVGGVMTLIIVSQSVIILILLLKQKKATNSQKRFIFNTQFLVLQLFSSLLHTVLALVRRWRQVAMRPMEWLNHSMRWWDCSYTLVMNNLKLNSFALDNTQYILTTE